MTGLKIGEMIKRARAHSSIKKSTQWEKEKQWAKDSKAKAKEKEDLAGRVDSQVISQESAHSKVRVRWAEVTKSP